MKYVIIKYEQELLSAVRKVLSECRLPLFDVEENRTATLFDLTITVDLDGKQHRFAADGRLRPTRKDIDYLAAVELPGRPLLVAVHLSESLVNYCKERNVNCLDLNGRIWIRAAGIVIDRNQLSPSVTYRLAEPDTDFFALKSSRVARALLHSAERTWRQADLAAATGLSQGLLSRLLNYAARQGWVEGKRGDWRLAQADALLDAWEAVDQWSKRISIRQYSVLETDLPALADRLVEHTRGELAFTQWFAAGQRYPYADVPVLTAYRREFPTEEEARALNYREVDDGGKVWIAIPRDDGVFRQIQRVNQWPLVSDAQIYLDLIHVGFRGPDQARALREWKGFCRT